MLSRIEANLKQTNEERDWELGKIIQKIFDIEYPALYIVSEDNDMSALILLLLIGLATYNLVRFARSKEPSIWSRAGFNRWRH